MNTSRDVTPSRHHYERSLPQEDRQNGLDVFPTSEPPASPKPEVPPRQSKSTDLGEDRIVIEEHPNLTSLQPLPIVNEIRRSARVKARIEKGLNSNTAASAFTYNEPDQYRDAIASDDAPFWSAAVDREINSLIKNRTWPIFRLPPNHSVIRSRWTFKFKPGYGQQEDIYKARFVAKGFSQVPGLDFNEDEIYSPVVKHDSLRIILSIAASLDLELHQLDIKTTFLYGDLEEELYVQQPEGFVKPGEENMVCRLHKPLYGLRQSPRSWNEKFDSFLTQFGLVRSDVDPCIYYSRSKNPKDFIVIGIWGWVNLYFYM